MHAVWRDADDYPQAIASADLGVCLHRSSSGLDLPMKVLDMFGAGVPVCALDYGACLSELVSDGVNGLLFHTSDQLAMHFCTVLDGFPEPSPLLLRLRTGVARGASPTWQEAWSLEAGPTFHRLVDSTPSSSSA